MADIDFGTGPNTNSGDTLAQALVKLQNRLAAIGATVTLASLVPSTSFQIGTAVSGTLSGKTAGSTVVSNIPGVAVSGSTYSGTPSGSAATIANAFVETLAGAVGSPKSSPATVAAAAPTLGTLSTSGGFQIGTATSGSIIGATTGSTITGNIPGITVNSAARTYAGTPTGSAATTANGLVETLAGATGSPKSASITVAAAFTTPAAPTIAVTPGNAQISIGWTDGSNGGSPITAHKLYAGSSAGTLTLVGSIATGSPYVDSGLSNGTARFYALSAVNAVGESAQSGVASATPSSTALNNLTLVPTAAKKSASYTGAPVGKTAGSSITAASSDGTSLVGTTGNVVGTFTAKGTPTLSITEVLSGYTTKTTPLTLPVLDAKFLVLGSSSGAFGGDGLFFWSEMPSYTAWVVQNSSVGGYTTNQLLANADNGNYDAFYDATKTCVAFIQAGSNNLGNTPFQTAVQSYEAATNLILHMKNKGFYVILCTVNPRAPGSGVDGWNPGQEAERISYNNMVRANAGGADGICDIASDPIIGDAANVTGDPYWYQSDGLHMHGPAHTEFGKFMDPGVLVQGIKAPRAAVVTIGNARLSAPIVNGVASTGTIVYAVPGSTLTSNISGLLINSAARTYAWDGTSPVGTTANGFSEAFTGATNTPKPQSVAVAAGTLLVLGLSGSLVNGTASTGTILNALVGSSLVSNQPGLTINSAARTYAWDGTAAIGTVANALVETLANATNTPRSTPLTVSAAAPTVFSDSFARNPNEDLEASPNWTRVDGVAGGLRCVSNVATSKGTNPGNGTSYQSPDLGWASAYAETRFTTANNPGSMIATRLINRDSYLGVRWASATAIEVRTLIGGVSTQVATYNSTFASNVMVRLADFGTSFKVYANGTELALTTGSATVSPSSPPTSTRTGAVGLGYGQGIFTLFSAGKAAENTDTTAPIITSAVAVNQPENAAFSLSLIANETVTWAKRTGLDATFFTLSGNTLTLPAQDYEAPADGGANNTYICPLRATDTAGNFTDFDVTVTITDVVETGASKTSDRTTTTTDSTLLTVDRA